MGAALAVSPASAVGYDIPNLSISATLATEKPTGQNPKPLVIWASGYVLCSICCCCSPSFGVGIANSAVAVADVQLSHAGGIKMVFGVCLLV